MWTTDPDAERRAYARFHQFTVDPKAYWEERLDSPSLLGDLDNIMPNPGHDALSELEKMGRLFLIYPLSVTKITKLFAPGRRSTQ